MRLVTAILFSSGLLFCQQIDWVKQVKNKLIYDAREYGVKADGTTDNTTNLQTAITTSAAAGGVLLIPSGVTKITSQITIPINTTIKCDGAGDRWRSGKVGCTLQYTGTGDALVISPGGATGVQSVTIKGFNIKTSTGRYAIVMTGTSGPIYGVLIEEVFVSGFTNAIRTSGTVFDVTLRRFSATDTTGNLIHVIPSGGSWGNPSQWKFEDCYLIPTADGTWAVYTAATDATNDQVVAFNFVNTTVAEEAATGANGIWIHGQFALTNCHIEGLTGRASTVGIRYTGSGGMVMIGSNTRTWGVNLQVGDPTHKTWVATDTFFFSQTLAAQTADIQIVDGGGRGGTRLMVSNNGAVLSNLRESTDGEYRDVQLLNASSGQATDFRGATIYAGNVVAEQKTNSVATTMILKNSTWQGTTPILQFQLAGGGATTTVNPDGSISFNFMNLTDLPAAARGTVVYCVDCTPVPVSPHTCIGGGSGAWAFRVAGSAWACPF
jgi:hypothetical protein